MITTDENRLWSEELARLKTLDGYWTDTSFADVLHDCTPLTLSYFQNACRNEGVVGQVFRELGLNYHLPEGAPLIYESIASRPYINLVAYFNSVFADFPILLKVNIKGQLRVVLKTPLNKDLASLNTWVKWPFKLYSFLNGIHRRAQKTHANAERLLESSRNQRALLQRKISQARSVTELKDLYEEVQKLSQAAFQLHLKCDVLVLLYEVALKAQLKLLGFKFEVDDLGADPMQNYLNQCHIAQWDFAQGKLSDDSFMSCYGHRGFPDWELSSPRWREHPLSFEASLKALLFNEDPRVRLARLAKKRSATLNQLEQELDRGYRRRWAPYLKKSLWGYQAFVPLRESSKDACIQWMDLLRQIFLRLADFCQWKDEIFYLSQSEVIELFSQGANQNSLRAQALQNKGKWLVLKSRELPHIVTSKTLASIEKVKVTGSPTSSFLTGKVVAKGNINRKIEGVVRVMGDWNTQAVPKPDEILVMKSADPSMFSLLSQAKAILLEQGSVLSHVAIYAREQGIPCLVAVEGVTQTLHSGDFVAIDLEKGAVKIINKSHS